MAGSLSIGTCRAHGKMLLPSRKLARRHARRVCPGQNMSAYECDETGMWHIGHLPPPVMRGELDRERISTRRIDVTE